jgi:hypothetical protein
LRKRGTNREGKILEKEREAETEGKKQKLGGKIFGEGEKAVTEREARREKGERNRKQRPNRREEKQKKRRNEAETGGIFGFPAAAPLSPRWPSATTIQHSHFTTTTTATPF